LCRGGAFGTVRVGYTTYAVDKVEEATADGSSVLDYYNSPRLGTPLPLAALGTSWNVTDQISLQVCTTYTVCQKKKCATTSSIQFSTLQ